MTAPAIQAIQTEYRGYKFRSRLEARWAVFFDTLNLNWEYEPEGFELPDGQRYLPDFYLRGVGGRGSDPEGIYVEIKPTEPTKAEEAKAAQLAAGLKTTVAILTGQVRNDDCGHYEYAYRPFNDDADGECAAQALEQTVWDNYMVFMKCYTCGAIKYEFLENNYCYCHHCGEQADEDHPAFEEAIIAARSARFEFGETPR